MAKNSTPKGGAAKFRFVLLEGEVPEGDFNQFMGAIQNALKPDTKVYIQRGGSEAPKAIGTDEALDEPDFLEGQFEDEGDEEAVEARKKNPPRARKPVSCKVLDIDVSSFKSFVEGYSVKTDRDRYLVAMEYLSAQGGFEDGITANHVYTCFRAVGWPYGKKDFSQPLRNLKTSQLVVQGPKSGTFKINHLGSSKTDELKV